MDQDNKTENCDSSRWNWKRRRVLTSSFSESVTYGVFYSAGFSFLWVTTGYTRAGLLLYAVSIWATWRLGEFKQVKEWPLFSKIALVCGPVLIGLGLFFSTRPPTYAAIIPFLIYAGLSLIGGLQLRKYNS